MDSTKKDDRSTLAIGLAVDVALEMGGAFTVPATLSIDNPKGLNTFRRFGDSLLSVFTNRQTGLHHIALLAAQSMTGRYWCDLTPPEIQMVSMLEKQGYLTPNSPENDAVGKVGFTN